MNKPLVLVVEDDAAIRSLIPTTLGTRNYKHRTAGNGEMALVRAVSYNPEVVLLDLRLPDVDGVEIIKKIRSWSSMLITAISAWGEETDKIEALNTGADDYLTRLFSVEELLARLRVTSQRLSYYASNAGAETSVFENGELKIDYSASCVYLNDEELHLTPMEYKLLCLLTRNVGKVLTRSYITKEIWGGSWDNDMASLRVFMATLRKELEKDESSSQYIQTHVGIDYRMLRVQGEVFGGKDLEEN